MNIIYNADFVWSVFERITGYGLDFRNGRPFFVKVRCKSSDSVVPGSNPGPSA